jgi:adenylate kinase family enzyme
VDFYLLCLFAGSYVTRSLHFLTLFCYLDQLQGRADDNIETIRKRFGVFVESSLPVIQYYDSKGMVKKVYPFLCKRMHNLTYRLVMI